MSDGGDDGAVENNCSPSIHQLAPAPALEVVAGAGWQDNRRTGVVGVARAVVNERHKNSLGFAPMENPVAYFPQHKGDSDREEGD